MVQKIYFFIVGIFASFIAITSSLPVPLDAEGSVVKITLLSEKSHPEFRSRRNVDSNLPDHLSFGFPLNGDNKVLRLRKSKLLPTVTTDPLSTEQVNTLVENAGVYTDLESGAAMIVKREAEEYNLQGTFSHANAEWNLEPMTREKRDIRDDRSEGMHRINLIARIFNGTIISLVGDAYVDSKERPEQIATLGLKGQGQQQNQSEVQQRREKVHEAERVQRSLHRRKRAVTQHVVEIAFVADYADYQKWVEYVGLLSALREMRLWYTYVAESINIRYETINDPDIAISTVATNLKILTRDRDDDFIEDLIDWRGTFNGFRALDTFTSWHQTQSDIPVSDHYMLFTGFRMRRAIGVAYLDRVCTVSGVSITEDSITAAVGAIAAHELGHSLSAVHDGETRRRCLDRDEFIMSTVFGTPVDSGNDGNPWRFSSCSIDAFKDYLSDKACTLVENTSGDDELPAPSSGQRAGEVLSRNEQCQLSYQDSDSSYCDDVQDQNGGQSSLCGGMYCSIPNRSNFCQAVLPQEYTTCGFRKWCIRGYCVREGEDPPTPSGPSRFRECNQYILQADLPAWWNCVRDVIRN